MKERMMMNICAEIQQRQNYLRDRNLTSIYLGGGTPSVLTGQELNQLFDTIHTYFDWDLSAEITLEANPDDLSTDYLSMLRSTPVNRLSIGIQSRDEHQLKWMNRSHNASQGLGAIENALQKGFDQMTIDWIYGLPGLSDADWVESLQWMENLRIPHFSAYALTVEEHTALAYQIRKGRTEIPPDKSVVRQFDLLLDWADSSIYEQYEISNFSIPGHQAVHNSQYWTAVPYLGVGPSAHSFNGRQRHWNVANNTSYMKSIESGKLPLRSEPFRLIDRVNERIMTALRLSRGLSWAAFEKDYPTYLGPLKQRVQSHPEDHWWIRTQDFVKLSRAGMHYADRAAADLFFD